MRVIKLFKSRSIKYTWISTYIILFLLPLLISIIIFFRVDGTLKKEINKSNYFLLKQVQQYIDGLVRDTEKITINLAFNDRVQYFRNLAGEVNDYDRYKIMELNQELNKIVYNDAIEDIYIYYKKIDLVVSNRNVMESNDYFNMFAEKNNLNSSNWININNMYYNGSYINLNGNTVNVTNSDKLLAYMLSLPLNSSSEGFANIVLIIDKSKFLAMAEDIEALSKGSIGIINSNNEFILKSEEFPVTSSIKYDTLKDTSGVLYDDINGLKVAVSYLTSDSTKQWKYVSVMHTSEYWDRLEQYRKLIYIGVFLCITAGIVVSFFLFKKNYEPISNLIKSLSDFGYKNNDDNSDEYKIISNVLTNSMNEKKEIDKWISFQKEVLRCRHIENLLKGRSEDPSQKSPQVLDINFQWQYFSVISFNLEQLNDITQTDPAIKIETFKLIQFIIQNMLDELLKEKGKAFTVDMDSSIVCLLNLQGKEQELKFLCKDISQRIKEVIYTHYKIELSVCISNICKEALHISNAYRETVELAEIVEEVEGEKILQYDEILNRANNQYYYPIDQEQALVSALKYGDYEKVKKVLNHILEKNFNERLLNNNLVKCLKFNIIGSIINTVNDISQSLGEQYQVYLSEIEALVKYKSINKVHVALLPILSEICEKVNLDKISGAQIGEKVTKFINENFQDENLNISIIAETYNMHPSYISKLFKAQTGEGILDYLNKVRIDEAKKILKRNNFNLESVSKMVGYSNIKTFTRSFTKIVGITPGKFKDI